MLGINKYELNCFSKIVDIEEIYGQIFNALIGQSIHSYFVQWNQNENNWNEDGPIILLINEKQYEFTAYQLEYSLTIDKINLTNKLDWYGGGNEIPLKWTKNVFKNINIILHKPITNIYALEYGQGSSFDLVGFEFEFEGTKDCLHISNGLDCNTMKLYCTIPDDRNKRIEIIK